MYTNATTLYSGVILEDFKTQPREVNIDYDTTRSLHVYMFFKFTILKIDYKSCYHVQLNAISLNAEKTKCMFIS